MREELEQYRAEPEDELEGVEGLSGTVRCARRAEHDEGTSIGNCREKEGEKVYMEGVGAIAR